jgi:hypothetical protein
MGMFTERDEEPIMTHAQVIARRKAIVRVARTWSGGCTEFHGGFEPRFNDDFFMCNACWNEFIEVMRDLGIEKREYEEACLFEGEPI